MNGNGDQWKDVRKDWFIYRGTTIPEALPCNLGLGDTSG